MKTFSLNGDDLDHLNLWPSERLWELTNTRYILKYASLVSVLNQQADAHHSFRIKTRLTIEPKPGLTAIEDAGDFTVVPDRAGEFALIEDNNALPRAKLYSHWQSPNERRRHSGNPGLSRI